MASKRTEQALELDLAQEEERILAFLRETVLQRLKRRGVVLGISGGIDSSTCAALAVRAFGPKRVRVLLMPEEDSDPKSTELGRLLAEHLGLEPILENITPILEGAGCYRRRDEAVRNSFPDFGPGWKMKIKQPKGLLETGRLNFFRLEVESPDGERRDARLRPADLAAIVASTNFKQRTRKMIEYHHADLCNFAVLGTPNRLEYDQGFFVKNGDGAADVKPIAHLYKTQVYAMARHLGLPDILCEQLPTTDTYSLEQTQEEFYFALPYDLMDRCLLGFNRGMSPAELGAELEMPVEQIEHVFADIERKRRTTSYLHTPPLTVEKILEA
jgi:NAD+ synthase